VEGDFSTGLVDHDGSFVGRPFAASGDVSYLCPTWGCILEQIEVGREMDTQGGVILPSVAAAGLLLCIGTGHEGPLLIFFFFVSIGQVGLVMLLEFYVPFLRSAVGFKMATPRPSIRFSAVAADLFGFRGLPSEGCRGRGGFPGLGRLAAPGDEVSELYSAALIDGIFGLRGDVVYHHLVVIG